MLIPIIPIAVATTILANQIITLIYGAKFLPSSGALAILIWSEIFVYYGLVHYEIVISTHQQRLYLLFTAVGAAVNVLLNLLWIPRYGIEGASAATLISYLLSAGPIIGHILPATRQYNMVGCKVMVKPLMASLVMGIGMYFLRQNFLASAVTGIILFFLMMRLIKGVDEQDIALFKAIFKKGS
jgi:O-antigen/teichoic acid export membrane protein